MVDSVESRSIPAKARERACSAGRGNLSVCHERGLADTKKIRSDGRNAIEQARERKRLTLANIRSAETRDVADEPQAEMVVEETEAAADYSLRVNRPSKTDTWRDIVCFLKGRIVVPA